MSDSRPLLRPRRWLAHLPLAILPFVAALAIERPQLEAALEARVTAALARSGAGWAKVSANARDIEIRGTAPGRAAVDAAVKVAEATFGVRRVTAHVGTGGLP